MAGVDRTRNQELNLFNFPKRNPPKNLIVKTPITGVVHETISRHVESMQFSISSADAGCHFQPRRISHPESRKYLHPQAGSDFKPVTCPARRGKVLVGLLIDGIAESVIE